MNLFQILVDAGKGSAVFDDWITQMGFDWVKPLELTVDKNWIPVKRQVKPYGVENIQTKSK